MMSTRDGMDPHRDVNLSFVPILQLLPTLWSPFQPIIQSLEQLLNIIATTATNWSAIPESYVMRQGSGMESQLIAEVTIHSFQSFNCF